ncbi:hypothetical protein H0H92_006622 [Tricholoma furcatifolium]|nr:hypothetical protein H0H92_006622 [Tricholoma furcatifolium]
MSVPELEQRTCHAYHLALRWLSGHLTTRRTLIIDSTSNVPVSDVRFLPGRSGDWIMTVSKGVWDVLSIWDLSSSQNDSRKVCQWSKRGALFNGIVLNTDSGSDATLAVSVSNDGVQLISLRRDKKGVFSLQPIFTLPSGMKPTKLHGDLLALSDEVSQTVIWNWRTRLSAVLLQPDSEAGIWHPNRSIQVVFAYKSVLVVRACSIHLFPFPHLQETPSTYSPIAHHSFGWLDGISVTHSPLNSRLSILLRSESDDPWSSGLHSLDYYNILRNPDAAVEDDAQEDHLPPYLFPPTLVAKVSAVRGSLRCRNVILGPCGTAVWIQPRDRAVVGLAWPDEEYPLQTIHPESGHESLMVSALPGPLAQIDSDSEKPEEGGVVKMRSSAVYRNDLNNWTALDYDEEVGRIVLCSSFGSIMVLEL